MHSTTITSASATKYYLHIPEYMVHKSVFDVSLKLCFYFLYIDCILELQFWIILVNLMLWSYSKAKNSSSELLRTSRTFLISESPIPTCWTTRRNVDKIYLSNIISTAVCPNKYLSTYVILITEL